MMSMIELKTVGRHLRARALHLLADESGPTATEYGIMLAVLLIIVIGAITAMGEAHRQVWADVGAALAPIASAS